jgi:hypothetical protein
VDPTNLALGVFAIGFGLFTLVIRATNPSWFGKLAAMKQQWGDAAGNAIHLIAYTIVPILVGVALIVASVKGVSFVGQ